MGGICLNPHFDRLSDLDVNDQRTQRITYSSISAPLISVSDTQRPAADFSALRTLFGFPVTNGCHLGNACPKSKRLYAQLGGNHFSSGTRSGVSCKQSGTML